MFIKIMVLRQIYKNGVEQDGDLTVIKQVTKNVSVIKSCFLRFIQQTSFNQLCFIYGFAATA